MEFTFLAISIFVIIIFIDLGIILPIYKSHRKATGGIINYDASMRKFVYGINLSRDDIIHSLSLKNVFDELYCTFDFDESMIRFSEENSHRDYYFQIQECNGFSILRLKQVALIGESSLVPYKLNQFMVSKLQAEIIPYSLYGI